METNKILMEAIAYRKLTGKTPLVSTKQKEKLLKDKIVRSESDFNYYFTERKENKQ